MKKKKLSEKVKKSISDKMKKSVLNKETGEIYKSLKEASEVSGVSYGSLSHMLNGRRENNTNMMYAEVMDYKIDGMFKSRNGRRFSCEMFFKERTMYIKKFVMIKMIDDDSLLVYEWDKVKPYVMPI